jgi:hypothetical protein
MVVQACLKIPLSAKESRMLSLSLLTKFSLQLLKDLFLQMQIAYHLAMVELFFQLEIKLSKKLKRSRRLCPLLSQEVVKFLE